MRIMVLGACIGRNENVVAERACGRRSGNALTLEMTAVAARLCDHSMNGR
jgi:hypothetical protein